jgi:hypothetical protein
VRRSQVEIRLFTPMEIPLYEEREERGERREREKRIYMTREMEKEKKKTHHKDINVRKLLQRNH